MKFSSFIYIKEQTTSSLEEKKEYIFFLTSSKANLVACLQDSFSPEWSMDFRIRYSQNSPVLIHFTEAGLFILIHDHSLPSVKKWNLKILFKTESKSPHLQIIKLAGTPQETVYSSGKSWRRSWEIGVVLQLWFSSCLVVGTPYNRPWPWSPISCSHLFLPWPQKTLLLPSLEIRNEFPDQMIQFCFD